MPNLSNGLAILVECQDCNKKFEVSSGNEVVQHKKEFKVNGQSIFLTYYDCPECGRRHYVQIDTVATLQELKEVERMFVKLSVIKKNGGGNMTSTNKKLNSLDKKLKEDELVFERIRNKDLICVDCKSRYNDDGLFGNVSRCEMFQQKPNEVLRGGMCIEYEKDETYTG